jgi:predicted secreted protein
VILSESSPETVKIKAGQHLSIRLRAQLGSGFSWALADQHGDTLRLDSETLIPAGDSAPSEDGTDDIQVFTFVGVLRGPTSLLFGYRRPWEEPIEFSKQKRFAIVVD